VRSPLNDLPGGVAIHPAPEASPLGFYRAPLLPHTMCCQEAGIGNQLHRSANVHKSERVGFSAGDPVAERRFARADLNVPYDTVKSERAGQSRSTVLVPSAEMENNRVKTGASARPLMRKA
jgi:hypothetical protein